MGINKVILVGHVGKDPVVQYVKEDVPVARFTLATSESFRDKNGQKVTNTEWHNIVAWRGLAKIAEQYVKKGTQVYIEGKITNRSYEKDGATKYISEIVAASMELLGRPADSSNQSTAANTSSQADVSYPQNGNNTEIEDFGSGDDLPF
ncbi:MAG: single-stranded DNA-binding protein [Bacteroidales bacterium]